SGTLTLTGGITGSGNALTVGGAGDTTVSSVIGTGSGTLTKDGAGTLTLNGSSANTFSGTATVNAGTLKLSKASGNAIAGNLTIGDGSGTDTAQLTAASQIADTSAVTINSSGVLDLNGNAETIGSLTSASSSAQVTLGAGTLTVGDANSTTYSGTI